jgi:DNA-directed RNA polymerase subunit RPC12/RpoP
MDYVCLQCRKIIEPEHLRKRIRCPYCGSKILLKKTTGIERKIKAL